MASAFKLQTQQRSLGLIKVQEIQPQLCLKKVETEVVKPFDQRLVRTVRAMILIYSDLLLWVGGLPEKRQYLLVMQKTFIIKLQFQNHTFLSAHQQNIEDSAHQNIQLFGCYQPPNAILTNKNKKDEFDLFFEVYQQATIFKQKIIKLKMLSFKFSMIINFNYKVQQMSRDSLIIQRKLLDAFIPVLTKQESSNPFRSKELSNALLADSQVSLSRQIYISSEQNLEGQSIKCSRISTGSQSKAKSRKYLKIYSQPKHQISSRDSSLGQSRTQTISNQQRGVNTIQRTFQRSNRSKSLSTHGQKDIHQDSRSIFCKDPSNSNLHSERSLSGSRYKARADSSYQIIVRQDSELSRPQIYPSSQLTRVNSLKKLIENEDIVVKNNTCIQAAKTGFYKNIIYSQNPHLIQNTVESSHLQPRQPLLNQLNSQILQYPPNIHCRPLFNGEPAFRTIIKKQIYPDQTNNIHETNKTNSENLITVQTLVRSDFKHNNFRGMNENLGAHSIFNKKLLIHPTNIRNQIVSQLLR